MRGYGLQSVATVITEPDLETDADGRVIRPSANAARAYSDRGVQHPVDNCGRLECWGHGCADQDGDKLANRHGQDWVTSTPFTVYAVGPDCSGQWGRDQGPARARARLQSLEWAAVERAVLTGQCGADPTLIGPAGGAPGELTIYPGGDPLSAVAEWRMFSDWAVPVMPAGTDPVSRVDALALIEWAMRDYGGTGVIHAPSWTYPYFRRWEIRDGQMMTTQIGTRWAFGRGYWSVAPGDTETVEPDTPPDVTQAWIYATGAVRIWRSAIWSPDDDLSYDWRQNVSTATAERSYTVSIQCPHVAVLVDLTT